MGNDRSAVNRLIGTDTTLPSFFSIHFRRTIQMRLKETVRTDYYTQIGPRLVCSPQKQTVVHIQDKVNTKLFLPAALFRGRHKDIATGSHTLHFPLHLFGLGPGLKVHRIVTPCGWSFGAFLEIESQTPTLKDGGTHWYTDNKPLQDRVNKA